MLACKIADMLFKTPTKIARIRATEYLREDKLFGADALPVDMHISPEQLVTDQIKRLIEYPGALQVVDFADGKVQRSEEHTSDLQSLMRNSYAVFCLKKKTYKK